MKPARAAIVAVGLVTAPALAAKPGVSAPAPAAARPSSDGSVSDGYDPDRRAAARRLLDASGFRARQQALAAESWQAARAERLADCLDRAVDGRRPDCSSSPAEDAKVKAILAGEQERTLDTLGEAAETLYAGRFTAAEMDQLSTFFESDIGRKYSQAYPGILVRFQTAKSRILLDAINAAHHKVAGGAGATP